MTDPRITEATRDLAEAISMLHNPERPLITLAHMTAASAVKLLAEMAAEVRRTKQVEREVTAPAPEQEAA